MKPDVEYKQIMGEYVKYKIGDKVVVYDPRIEDEETLKTIEERKKELNFIGFATIYKVKMTENGKQLFRTDCDKRLLFSTIKSILQTPEYLAIKKLK